MKIIKLYSSLIIASLAFLACEKDDLCDGSDNQTPRLHITLLDQYNVENKKSAQYIKTYVTGNDKILEYNNTAELYLPLTTTNSSTEWNIELYSVNGTEKTLIGTEILKFNYALENVYISKACGYKTVYNAFSYEKNTNSWIGGISLTTNTVTDELNTHLQIFY